MSSCHRVLQYVFLSTCTTLHNAVISLSCHLRSKLAFRAVTSQYTTLVFSDDELSLMSYRHRLVWLVSLDCFAPVHNQESITLLNHAMDAEKVHQVWAAFSIM